MFFLQLLSAKTKDYPIIYQGIFDTDGTVTFIRNKTYPSIRIQIKSKEFMKNLKILLEKLGFISNLYCDTLIILYGPIQLKKWYDEIGSNNPKHLDKIKSF